MQDDTETTSHLLEAERLGNEAKEIFEEIMKNLVYGGAGNWYLLQQGLGKMNFAKLEIALDLYRKSEAHLMEMMNER